ncbi:MAG: hypothetical protein ABI337_07400 [Nitrososphaera sp.]
MNHILKGEKEYDETADEFSLFEQKIDETPVKVEYNPDIPIGEFDFIVIPNLEFMSASWVFTCTASRYT